MNIEIEKKVELLLRKYEINARIEWNGPNWIIAHAGQQLDDVPMAAFDEFDKIANNSFLISAMLCR